MLKQQCSHLRDLCLAVGDVLLILLTKLLEVIPLSLKVLCLFTFPLTRGLCCTTVTKDTLDTSLLLLIFSLGSFPIRD